MPWNEVTKLDLKEEFVLLALNEGSNMSALCRSFGISRKTGYKLLARYKEHGPLGLKERPRHPICQPFKTPEEMQRLILKEKKLHPDWGARMLKQVLEDQGIKDVPGRNSVHRVLKRHGFVKPQEEMRTRAWNFFEHEHPNDLWQMDFKGHFVTGGGRCHPLTILDDHSRFSIALNAYNNEQGETVKIGIIEAFRRYGLPRRINVDNGPPWGTSSQKGYTAFAIWLMRLGVQVTHSRPFHPQTNGKDERFHRTLNTEVLKRNYFTNLSETQKVFDEWRHIYNTKRPHRALDMNTPISRYAPSPIVYPEILPAIEYGPDDIVKTVNSAGYICLDNVKYYISEGLSKEPIALRPTLTDGEYEVFYCSQRIKLIDPEMGI